MATILIVDSQNDNRQPLISLLGRHGHRVLEAASSEKALEIVRSEKPDLVLTDLVMPDMGGSQLVMNSRGVTLRPGGSSLPVSSETERRAPGRARGVQYFVRKPEVSDTLIGMIDAALSTLPPRPEEPHAAPPPDGTRIKAPVSRLRRRLADLENLNLELGKRLHEAVEQLEVARSALKEEVTKRIWAERELTRANLQLRERAVRDALTGVHNRGYLEESLVREESRARRSGQPLGVIMIDIDHFKQFNDTFGHAAGDAVLRALGKYVLSVTRGEDTFCRYGGEEFVLIMTDTTARAVWERAEALRTGVQDLKIEHEGRDLGRITLSIGVAMIPDHAKDGQSALQAADAALYRAKQGGRNRAVMADTAPGD